MVLPASHKVSRAPWYSGVESCAFVFRLRDFHPLRFNFPVDSARLPRSLMTLSTTPKTEVFGLASYPFARRYLGNRFYFLLLRVLRCFSSPSLPPLSYVFT